MRKILLILLCLSLAGCTTVSKAKKLEKQASELQSVILKQKEEIKAKEGELKEKELKIQELQKKLEGFGVF